MFIAFEGGEGCGKSTQIRMLEDKLRNEGYYCELTREPGGTTGAEEIRKLLVEGEPDRWHMETEALLFMAARSDHIVRKIRPALLKGHIVLCDRYVLSSIVYQGIVRGLGEEWVIRMHGSMPNMIWPNLNIVLDVDPSVGLARAQSRGTLSRFERMPLVFHDRIRKGYLTALGPNRNVQVVDGSKEPRQVHDQVWAIVSQFMGSACLP